MVFASTVVMVSIMNVIAPTGCARILAIETVAYKSCWNFMSGVLRALSDNGHVVTAFTPFPDGDRVNYTEVDVSSAYPNMVANGLDTWMSSSDDHWNVLLMQMVMDKRNCETLRGDRRLRDLFANGLSTHFDAVVIEHNYLDCMSRAIIESGVPLIFTVSTPTYFAHERVTHGHYSNPVIVTTLLSDRAVATTFVQRLRSAAAKFYDNAIVAFLDLQLRITDPELYELHAPVPPSLTFINNHFSSEPASPTPANVIRVGGIHLKPEKQIPNVRSMDFCPWWLCNIKNVFTYKHDYDRSI